jgi:4-amino-4-deoxy-L-arabinose transferase-like glycosyltransferase
MSGLAQRNGGPVGLAILVAILLLGLGLRLDYAWDGREPVFDAAAYAEIAVNLERGEGFTLGAEATQPASNYSPGLPLLVAGIYELTGGVHARGARIVLALIGALVVLFTYLIGRRLSGPTAGLAGAGTIAIYPALLEYQGMFMGEPLAATLLSGAVLSLLWADARQGHPARGSCRGGGGARRPLPPPPPPPPPATRAPDGYCQACCSEHWRWCDRSTSASLFL